MTKCNYIYNENIIAIDLLTATDTRFRFPNGSKWLSYMKGIGKNVKGMTLCILFTGLVKNKHQFEHNYVLSFVPLTRMGWQNARDLIVKYSIGKWTFKPVVTH